MAVNCFGRQLFWPSNVFAFHELAEATEQIVRVVRSRRGLGMILHREHRPLAVSQSLARAVVEVDVTRLPSVLRHGVRIDGEAVVLRRDLDLPRREVLHGVVRAVMAERQLVRATAGGEAEDLMTEADPEHRDLAEKLPYRVDEIRHGFRIAGTVGKKPAGWP